MSDLFIKRRKPDGTFGVLEPVIKGGKTTEEKLKEQIELNEHLMVAIAELAEVQVNNKVELQMALVEMTETLLGAN